MGAQWFSFLACTPFVQSLISFFVYAVRKLTVKTRKNRVNKTKVVNVAHGPVLILWSNGAPECNKIKGLILRVRLYYNLVHTCTHYIDARQKSSCFVHLKASLIIFMRVLIILLIRPLMFSPLYSNYNTGA